MTEFITSNYELDSTKTQAHARLFSFDCNSTQAPTWTWKPGDKLMFEVIVGCDTAFNSDMTAVSNSTDCWDTDYSEDYYSVYQAHSQSLAKAVIMATCTAETTLFEMHINADLDIPDFSNTQWRVLVSPSSPPSAGFSKRQAAIAESERKLIAAEIKQRLARAKVTARQKTVSLIPRKDGEHASRSKISDLMDPKGPVEQHKLPSDTQGASRFAPGDRKERRGSADSPVIVGYHDAIPDLEDTAKRCAKLVLQHDPPGAGAQRQPRAASLKGRVTG
jgi:hypothetical protein